MIKKVNTITKLDKPTKKFRPSKTKKYEFLEEYRDLFTFKMKPVSQAFIERLADDYVKWANKSDSLVLNDFCDERYIEPRSFNNWCNKFEEMKEAHVYAKRRISSRREKGAITRQFDAGFIKESMPIYDQDWKDLAEWRSKIKADGQDSGQAKVIVLSDLEYKKIEDK